MTKNVRDLHEIVRPGALTLVGGPSGSGKTFVLAMLQFFGGFSPENIVYCSRYGIAELNHQTHRSFGKTLDIKFCLTYADLVTVIDKSRENTLYLVDSLRSADDLEQLQLYVKRAHHCTVVATMQSRFGAKNTAQMFTTARIGYMADIITSLTPIKGEVASELRIVKNRFAPTDDEAIYLDFAGMVQ